MLLIELRRGPLEAKQKEVKQPTPTTLDFLMEAEAEAMAKVRASHSVAPKAMDSLSRGRVAARAKERECQGDAPTPPK